MRSILDAAKREAKFVKSRMNYLGIKNYHLLSIVFLEIIGWTLIFILGYKAYHCC